MSASIFLLLPLTTFYLSVSEIGLFALMSLLSQVMMAPLNTGANLIINAYYFSLTESKKRELFSHLYLIEIGLKILSFILVLFLGDVLLKVLVEDYNEELIIIFYLLTSSIIFSCTKPLLDHFFTVRKESTWYVYFNVADIVILILCTFACLHIFELGLKGYALAILLSAALMFIINVKIISRYTNLMLKKRWLVLIYLKGIRLFYANLFENIVNFYDSFIVQKTLSLQDLGLYSHGKQYAVKLGMLDKAFFQSYSVSYLKMLNEEAELKVFKVSLFWYGFLLLLGVGLVVLSDNVIALLTHDKLTASAEYLCIFYISVFFRSNQMPYNLMLLHKKKTEVFVSLAVLSNLIGASILTLGVFFFGLGIHFVVLCFVLNSVLKNIAIKGYAFYLYRAVDESEVVFWVALASYVLVLKNLGGYL
jgi:O-antigen/teichoic acid export membrane protein